MNQNHETILWQGVDAWNEWRGSSDPNLVPNLGGAYLSGRDLGGVHLYRTSLRNANLVRTNLVGANLVEAEFSGANLAGALGIGVAFGAANLVGADLREANLRGANFHWANLRGADLTAASLVDADIRGADLTNCRVYGISAWRVKLDEQTKQQNLIITPIYEPEITVDDIEVAQFVYLLLNNKKIRNVIDTITSKVVLILGRFTDERKVILDALRDELRKPERNYVPIMFDFDKSSSQTTVETVTLLARMARFVIADISDAKSVLQELQAIVPTSPKLAVQPLIIAAQDEPGMFDFFRYYPWVLKTRRYKTLDGLRNELNERVIRPAEAKVLELRGPQPG